MRTTAQPNSNRVDVCTKTSLERDLWNPWTAILSLHAVEEGDVSLDNSEPFGFVHVQAPFAAFEGPAQEDAVLARKHIQVTSESDVVDLRFRQQHRELPFDRHALFVAKRGLGPQPGAVDYDRLIERGKLTPIVEPPNHQLPAREEKVAQDRIQVDRRLDQHGDEAMHVGGGERGRSRRQISGGRIEIL